MGRKSTIELHPEIRAAADRAIQRGSTIEAITDMINDMGVVIVSKSGVGRYTKKYAELADQQRDIKSVADAFASEFGSGDDNQTRLMLQAVTTLITQSLLPQITGQQNRLDPMSLRLLAAAVKDATSAIKIDDDRRRNIRKDAFKEAADVAEEAGKRAGASMETLRAIRAEILGIDA